MKYVGSKGRHVRSILPIVLRNRRADQAYVEPFVGGASMLSAVDGRRIAGDLHAPLIAMWQAVSRGWSPRSHSEALDSELYAQCKLRAKQGSLDPIDAFMGFSLSFGGKWFGGFRNDPSGRRDYAAEALRAADDQFPRLVGVDFHHSSYEDLPIPDRSIIYCDPPYRGTLGYATGAFNHDAFWRWCRAKRSEDHEIFVSEYSAPSDFECVWEKAVKSTLDRDTGAKSAIERLYRPC